MACLGVTCDAGSIPRVALMDVNNLHLSAKFRVGRVSREGRRLDSAVMLAEGHQDDIDSVGGLRELGLSLSNIAKRA